MSHDNLSLHALAEGEHQRTRLAKAAHHAAGERSLKKIILLVSHSSKGGAQELWTNLAEGLRLRGHEVALMALYPGDDSAEQPPPDLSWRYVTPERPRSIGSLMSMFTTFVNTLAFERPDAVISALPASNIMAALAARAARLGPMVICSHHTPIGTYNRFLNTLDGVVGGFRQVRAIVSVSNAVSRSLDKKPKRYRAKRVVCMNAVPPAIEEQLVQLRHRRLSDVRAGNIIVACGRLAPQKNYPTLIRAAMNIPAGARIKIIGSGPDEHFLKDLARQLDVHDRIDFLGALPRQEAMRVVASGDLFVQPSLYEGHSLALIEAAKLGLPLVVSDVPVQIESITDTNGTRCGITVPPHDDVALAKAITAMLQDPSLREEFASRSVELSNASSFNSMLNTYETLLRHG